MTSVPAPVADIPTKRPPKRIKLFRQGELGRMIVDVIRRSGGEASLQEIVTGLLAAGGLGTCPALFMRNRARAFGYCGMHIESFSLSEKTTGHELSNRGEL